jgi:hypothetical protein
MIDDLLIDGTSFSVPVLGSAATYFHAAQLQLDALGSLGGVVEQLA